MNANDAITAIDALATLLDLINKQVAKAKERGEWTPEEEAAYDAKAEKIFQASHWKRND